MSEQNAPGHLGWLDLSVSDAPGIRDFYADVVGWAATGHSMGEYEDFVMSAADGEAIAGICHSRDDNAGLPAMWIPYVVVEDLTGSVARAKERGGHVLGSIREMGGQGRYAFVRDPAGAVLALFQHLGA